MLNLNDLYYFVQVVDRKGFTAASRALNVPKSSLSKRVAALEERLGVRLIQRSSRRFVVTDVGRDFHRHAAAMLVEAEAAEGVVKKRLAEPSGIVRLTASMTTAQVSFASLLPRLAELHPKIQIVMHATNRYVDLIEERYDIAVRAHYSALPSSNLVQQRLGMSPVYLVASPRYLERRGAPREPSDIARHDGLLSSPGERRPLWRLRSQKGETTEVQPVPRYFLDEPLTLMNAAIGGLGIACLPHALCWPSIEAGTLTRVLPDWSSKAFTITMLTPHRRLRLPAVRVIVDFLAAELPAAMGLRQPAADGWADS